MGIQPAFPSLWPSPCGSGVPLLLFVCVSWECYQETVLQAVRETLGNQAPESQEQGVGTGVSQTQQVPRSWRPEQSWVTELGQRQAPEVSAKEPAKSGPIQGLFTRTGQENQVINTGPRRG